MRSQDPEQGVWRLLVRYGLTTRSKRLALIDRHRDPLERVSSPPRPSAIDASETRKDCFYIGRPPGTKGAVWQYTAADVASGFAWAKLHATPSRTLHRRAYAPRARQSSKRPTGLAGYDGSRL